MKTSIFREIWLLLSAIVLASCGTSDMIRPSQKIGPMWVNRYGHTTAENIWDHCDGSMTDIPGTQTTDCTIPWVDELFIGHGIYGMDTAQRDALWNATTWELFIDGHAVDLPAFNIADFEATQDDATYQYRVWRIRLRKIPEGLHTLRYVMHVNQQVDGVFDAQSIGAYELIVNFTFGK
ncbi:MAG: hypothetical protein IPO22_09755 [Anaerolineales bacterium]|nr:hypothetical protein [Anaerolineales bacterium]